MNRPDDPTSAALLTVPSTAEGRHGSAPHTTEDKRGLHRPRRIWAPYFFLVPFACLFVTFTAYPLGRSFVLSFQKTAGAAAARSAGLSQYGFLLHDLLFWLACANTLAYAVLLLPLELGISLGLALLLNQPNIRARALFRFAFFSTYLVGQVFLAMLAYVLLSPRQGLINRAIGVVFPWLGTELNWRGDPNLALPALVLASLWISLGYAMVYWLAALQAVDVELYEAARIDGAGPWRRLLHVTLPGIRPTASFLLLAGVIGALQLFELPWVFFQGAGPKLRGLTVVQYLYINGMQVGDLGFASAVGWALLVLILLIALGVIRLTGMHRRD